MVELVHPDAADQEVDKDREVQSDHRATLEKREMLARRDHPVPLVSAVHRVFGDPLDSLDQKAHKVCLAKTVNPDILDNEESPASKVKQVQLVLQVLLVLKEQPVKRVLRE